MIKSHLYQEIMQQPKVISTLINEYVKNEEILIKIPENFSRLQIIASGSSYNAAKIVEYFFNTHTELDVKCDYSSEFLLRKNFNSNKKTFFVFISQSGETSDTIKALNIVKERNFLTMAITNQMNSTLWKNSDYQLFLHAGKEESIASTKAVTAQILCLYLLFLKYQKESEGINITMELKELKKLSKQMSDFLAKIESINEIAERLTNFKNIVILGNRFYYKTAKEGALKIRETSYLSVSAYPFGEFLHGHVATLNEKTAVIALIDEENLQTNIQILRKIKSDYNPTIVKIASPNCKDKINIDFTLQANGSLAQLFNVLLFLQVLALKIAICLGKNIDNPIGLTKIVLE